MQIRTFRPSEYDAAMAHEATVVLDAASAVDSPHNSPVPERSCLLRFRHGWDGRGVDRVFHAYDDGRVVGHASVELSHWEDNRDLAWIETTVLPGLRRRGYGDAMHEAAIAYAVEAGKTLLMGATWDGSPAEEFPRRHGYQPGQHNVQRRL
ncbi:MAG: GNAT family N-acetyltransferase, partial [Propionibacteriales bacterium]|nr:GNAT family N-acetyltransferase [Propionibacteriales bacterium]